MISRNLVVLDTNVLIEILKNNQQTIKQVENIKQKLCVSVISAMELIYGARNKVELMKLQRFLELFHIQHIDQSTSKLSLKLVSKYSKSHTLDIPDSLIAATCIQHNSELLTYNLKDFKFIPELLLIEPLV